MDEELDYMSDEFIQNCAGTTNDIRPGLLKTHNEQRQHKLLKKKNFEMENKKKPAEVLQIEMLEESLKQPIGTTNKGFSMLEKMGFKSGMGLGKNNSGIKEPISINIKNNKVGLGHKASYRGKHVKSENKLDKISESDFRAFLSDINRKREILSDFRSSQRVCKELDLKCDKMKPEESWFWPDEKLLESEKTENADNEEGDDDNDVDYSDEEKLEMLTKYLRENYFYCIWCKVQYNDEKDMEDCPGPVRDNH